MTESLPDPLRLRRCDPTRNMARFYLMALQPTLFGEVALVRTWGRIGTRGQEMRETFDGAASARHALDRLAGQKTRKGYRQA
jgi:predicted DNA-binding WGR domain protein